MSINSDENYCKNHSLIFFLFHKLLLGRFHALTGHLFINAVLISPAAYQCHVLQSYLLNSCLQKVIYIFAFLKQQGGGIYQIDKYNCSGVHNKIHRFSTVYLSIHMHICLFALN